MREYHSALAAYIVGLIKEKQACGYSYEFEAYILESFDRFCIEHDHTAATISARARISSQSLAQLQQNYRYVSD